MLAIFNLLAPVSVRPYKVGWSNSRTADNPFLLRLPRENRYIYTYIDFGATRFVSAKSFSRDSSDLVADWWNSVAAVIRVTERLDAVCRSIIRVKPGMRNAIIYRDLSKWIKFEIVHIAEHLTASEMTSCNVIIFKNYVVRNLIFLLHIKNTFIISAKVTR